MFWRAFLDQKLTIGYVNYASSTEKNAFWLWGLQVSFAEGTLSTNVILGANGLLFFDACGILLGKSWLCYQELY